MDRKAVLGLLLCALIFGSGFVLTGDMTRFFNLSGFLVVFGGTSGVALASFRLSRLVHVFRVVQSTYRCRVKEPAEIVELLVDLSVKSRLRGVHTLSEDERETSILFLRRALGFVVDNYPREQTTDILNTEMFFFKQRRDESERVLRVLAEICPAIGLAGSVIGLIGMLSGVNNMAVILTTIPIALTSTLYGVLLSNFILLPMAARVREVTDHELLLQKIIVEGVRAIQSELNPRVLEAKLKSFLTPSDRPGTLVSLGRIKERFGIREKTEGGKVKKVEMEEPPGESA